MVARTKKTVTGKRLVDNALSDSSQDCFNRVNAGEILKIVVKIMSWVPFFNYLQYNLKFSTLIANYTAALAHEQGYTVMLYNFFKQLTEKYYNFWIQLNTRNTIVHLLPVDFGKPWPAIIWSQKKYFLGALFS
jgi:hypothetical protein